jgi:hypothetical protein
MDDQDKIFLWLVVIAFFGLLVATAIGWMEITELKSTETGTTQSTAPAK